MNILSTPIKFDDIEVKKQMIATRYRFEQELTAMQGIKNCIDKNLAVELYAGTGGLTNIYKDSFKTVLTNDLNKDSSAQYHLTAMNFIKTILLELAQKIDLVDFDCYGCPAFEISEFFKIRGNFDAPFVLRFFDGLGLWMKRNKKQEVVKKRYLIQGNLDMNKIWLRHPVLIDTFLKKIAEQYGMKAERIISVQTKFKNYVLGVYKFENI